MVLPLSIKWFVIFCYACGLTWGGLVKAQTIELDLSDAAVEDAFSVLHERYGYHFVYVATALEGLPRISPHIRSATIDEAMKSLVQGLPLSYSIKGKVITVVKQLKEEPIKMLPSIRGYVMNAETGERIPNVSIQYVGKSGGASTSDDGTFQLRVPIGVDSIRWTAIGYRPHTDAFQEAKSYYIALQPTTMNMDEAVVTGIVERDRSRYTSSTTTFTGTQLKQIGNRDLINCLRTLDPSFIVIPNNLQGSNPNMLAQIELRGKTSLTGVAVKTQFGTDPNLPLFILDGFESSLQQITDLDINRIASVTLLKDAASSALYGAQSANGVVVVETLKPVAGKLNLFYTSDFSMERADVSDYNMMNATEKLEFERLAGRYIPEEENNPLVDHLGLDRAYNDRLRKVLSGVNYTWLNVPLQTAYAHNNSLYLQGGNARWQYGGGGNYKQRAGVMKGTGRNTGSAYADITFRTATWNIQGRSSFFGSSAFGSPTADFSRYVSQNPLYTPSDATPYLDEIPYPDREGSYREPNYVYDALLNSYEHLHSNTFIQQMMASWQLAPEWQLIGRVQLTNELVKADTFWSPKDTRYALLNARERGAYVKHRYSNRRYQGSVMAVWNHVISEDQFLTLNMRAEAMEIDINEQGFKLRGFPEETSGEADQSYNFAGNKLEPLPSPPTIRRVNALISGNYSLANRYFMDATLRVDGSTQFGSANRYSTFWSIGLGWNVHNEPFMQGGWEGLDMLRLRVNTGLTGNQSFGSFASTVSYHPITDDVSGGIIHESLGNPQLEWQNTQQTNIGVDVKLWKGRVSLTANLFEKLTSPLIAYVDLPPSTGVNNYALNVGDLRLRGYEGTLRFSPVYQPSGDWMWTIGVTALGYSSRFENLSDLLAGANERLKEAKALSRFQNGYSPDDLWAVRSLGIDPATGREVFLTRDGHNTYLYSTVDETKVGNQRPWVEGVVSCYVGFKDIQVGGYFRYSLGAARLNEALYQKVENINFDELSSNQDRRALYDRWQQVGDQARYKSISLLEETPISSRFLQKENIFSGESLSISYLWDAGKSAWLQRSGLQSVRITCYANDFLRISNILAERGTAYPFSRTYALSLSLTL